MENYLCVNGKKTALTVEQLKELGFITADKALSEIDELITAIRSGKAREDYSIGDRFMVGDYEFKIIGFDHDRDHYDETLPTVTLMSEQLIMNRQWHSGTFENGWIESDVREWLNSEFIDELPQGITKYICTVDKLTHNCRGKKFITEDKLFLPSESELFGSAIYASREDGARYEAFTTSQNRIMYDDNNDEHGYFTRSVRGGASVFVCCVGGDGTSGYVNGATDPFAFPVCFTIA